MLRDDSRVEGLATEVDLLPDKLPTNSRASKFQGEIDLLQAIERPKVSHAKQGKSLEIESPRKPWLTDAEAAEERRSKPDYLKMSKTELKRFRQKTSQKGRKHEESAELGNVLILPRKMTEASTELTKLKQMTKSRQLRHDEAVGSFKTSVVEISDRLETRVIDLGRELRDKLSEWDTFLKTKMDLISDESSLRLQDYKYVEESWEGLACICTERKKAITQFDIELESVESTRSCNVGNELRGLVDVLVDISYVLRGEVERLVEFEAHEINAVIINNLRAKNDVVARMLKNQVFIFHSTKISWTKAELKWRELRHRRGLEEWKTLINSKLFTAPSDRQNVFEAFGRKKIQLHEEKRLVSIESLQGLLNSDSDGSLGSLTLENIASIEKKLADVNLESLEANKTLHETLVRQMEQSMATMLKTQESLRSELHSYAAYATEGDIFTTGERGKGSRHKSALGAMVLDSELHEFFRKSGGLKQEITHIVATLELPELIHNSFLENFVSKLQLLSDARQVASVMEAEGKTSELKMLESNLEKLRIAKKAELPALVGPLYNQTLILQRSAIPDRVKQELEICLNLLLLVQPDLNSHLTEGTTEEAAEEAALEEDSLIEEVEDDDTQMQIVSAEVAYKEKPFLTAELRAAQKRIGTVVYTCKLPNDFQTEITSCFATLETQMSVNSDIDKVIQENCSNLITQRESEMNDQLNCIAEGESAEQERIVVNCDRLVKFFIMISNILEGKNKREYKTDVQFQTSLDDLEDHHEEFLSNFESAFDSAVDQLRHAPNKQALASSFEKALRILQDIESEYRSYYQKGIGIAQEHPFQSSEEACQVQEQLLSLFGLSKINPIEANSAISQEFIIEENPEEAESISEADRESTQKEDQNDLIDQCEESPHESPDEAVAFLPDTFVNQQQQSTDVPIYREYGHGSVFQETTTFSDFVNEFFQQHDQQKEQDGEEEECFDNEPIEEMSTECNSTGQEEEKVVDKPVLEPNMELNIPKLAILSPVPPIEVSHNLVSSILECLRDSVFTATIEAQHSRAKEMESLHNERCEIFTEELEERLRLHWPRQGRTDVKYQQPRIGELLKHQQRHDRHIRSVTLKCKSQEEQFKLNLESLEASIKKFRQCMQGILLHLESQTSVASLQGIQKRGKDTIAAFQGSSREQKEQLMPFVRRSNELFEMNTSFISSCAIFENGGDYNEHEVKLERESLKQVDESLMSTFTNRSESVELLFEKIRSTRIEYSNKFMQEYDRCLQSLSVREGLGPKYGAPRRHSQEMLRSEISRSDSAEKYIDGLLEQLNSCKRAPEITDTLDSLRKCFYRRAKYLEFFLDASKAPVPCSLEGLPGNEEEINIAMPASDTFSSVVRTADQECQDLTLSLYKQEGLLDDLQLHGQRKDADSPMLPESLLIFLADLDQKRCKYLEQSSRRLRKQISHFYSIVETFSSAIFSDISETVKKSIVVNQPRFDAVLSDSCEEKRNNENMLRPQLGDPNALEELDSLCKKESTRIDTIKASIVETHKEAIDCFKIRGKKFEDTLLNSSKVLLALLDSVVLISDLKPLPDHELVVPKRMGLRRLQQARMKSENVSEETSLTITDRETFPAKEWQGLCLETFQNAMSSIKPILESETIENSGDNYSESIVSLSTPHHKHVVAARDFVYEEFIRWWMDSASEVDQHYRNLLSEEQTWFENWEKSIEELKNL